MISTSAYWARGQHRWDTRSLIRATESAADPFRSVQERRADVHALRRRVNDLHSRLPPEHKARISTRLADAARRVALDEDRARTAAVQALMPIAPGSHPPRAVLPDASLSSTELLRWVWETEALLPIWNHAHRKMAERLIPAARHLVKKAVVRESLGLPAKCNLFTAGLAEVRAWRRYAREVGEPTTEIDRHLKNRRRARDAEILAAKRQRRAGMVTRINREEARLARKRERERARAERGLGVAELDEKGLAFVPDHPTEDTREALRRWIDRADAAICQLWYAQDLYEEAVDRLATVRTLREFYWRALEAMPPARPAPGPQTRDEVSDGAKAILAWVAAQAGEDRDGLRWLPQERITWFRQRERRIREVAWREEREDGVWWGFDLSRG